MLLGPRQVGKSTLLREFEYDLIVDLADEGIYRDHLKDPSLLRAQVLGLVSKHKKILIDEIQRLPTLLNSVQSLIDSQKFVFMLTGSSARKLKKGGANLLPGRLFWYHLFPLSYWELKDQWDLTKSLTIGTLPEIYLQDYGQDLLSDYINSYLRQEIQAEAIVRNIDSYARFLDAAAENSGKIINYGKLASDSEIPKETLRRFYDILADTLLVQRLRGFTDIKGSRKALQREKFIFFDMGVRNAILKQHKNVFTKAQLGELFEQWFILQVISYASYERNEWEFYYYRDDLMKEVDLVIDCGDRLIAVEIKYSNRFREEFIYGLSAFRKYTKKATQCYLVYCGDTLQKRDEIAVMPYQDFLDRIAIGLI